MVVLPDALFVQSTKAGDEGEQDESVIRLWVDVTTPPMVGPTWPRVRFTLGSDCLPTLFQRTASFYLPTDLLIVVFVICTRMFDVRCPVILGLY